jgi:hypothetical protein
MVRCESIFSRTHEESRVWESKLQLGHLASTLLGKPWESRAEGLQPVALTTARSSRWSLLDMAAC